MTLTALEALKKELESEIRSRLTDELKPATHVVVRSSPSGVWFGRLESREGGEVTLLDARRAWQWTGAFSCSGLAAYGPSGGKITAPVTRAVIRECVEILDATPEAVARWAEAPEHKP